MVSLGREGYGGVSARCGQGFAWMLIPRNIVVACIEIVLVTKQYLMHIRIYIPSPSFPWTSDGDSYAKIRFDSWLLHLGRVECGPDGNCGYCVK